MLKNLEKVVNLKIFKKIIKKKKKKKKVKRVGKN